MKKLLTVVLALSIVQSTIATERSEKEMQAIAARQLSVGMRTRADAEGQPMPLQKMASAETYSIYAPTGKETGFVIVSNDDLFMPVLGYSTQTYNANSLPDGFRWWLGAIDESLRWRRANRVFTGEATFAPVENFIASQWGQSKPYNSLVPMQGTKRCVTGCVATALAQILNYYRYPESSTGMGSYTVADGGQINAELNTVYTWDSIRNTYSSLASYSDEEITPIAELMRDCGYASQMNYSASSSGTTCDRAAYALSRNFRFDDAYINQLLRSYYCDEEWMNLIYTELLSKRPIMYAGVDADNGDAHAFVFSGIDEEGRIYTNWGWDGTADGYFDMKDLNPKGLQGRSLNHFNAGQEMIMGITPDTEGINLKPKYSELCKNDSVYYSVNSVIALPGYVSVIPGNIYNIHYKLFVGKVDFVVVAQDGTQMSFNVWEGSLSLLNGVSMSTKRANLKGLPAGTYTAYLASKAEKDTYYQPIRCTGGAICYQITKAEDGTVTVSEKYQILYNQVATGIASVMSDQDNNLLTHVYTTDGRLVYTAPTNEFNINNVQKKGMLIIKSGKNVRKMIR